MNGFLTTSRTCGTRSRTRSGAIEPAAALREHLERDYPPVEVDDDTDPRRPTRRPASPVFRGAGGEPVNASTFSRTWTPVRTRVGLPPRWGSTAFGTTTRRC